MWFSLKRNYTLKFVYLLRYHKEKLTSASIVARRGIEKLELDMLASVSVAKTLIVGDAMLSSCSLNKPEPRLVKARINDDDCDFFAHISIGVPRLLRKLASCSPR